MKKENVLKDKSNLFAIHNVKLAQLLAPDNDDFVLTEQLLRSGTAIGLVLKQAEFAQSRAGYINNLSLALKEANLTEYWLRLLKETDYIDKKMFDSMIENCDELISMLVASIKTTKGMKNENSKLN